MTPNRPTRSQSKRFLLAFTAFALVSATLISGTSHAATTGEDGAAAAEDTNVGGNETSEPAEPGDPSESPDAAWLRSKVLDLLLTGRAQEWSELGENTSPEENPLGIHASAEKLFDLLADADATVEKLGTEEIRGVSTTHHRATVDLAKLAGDLPPEARVDLEAAFGADLADEFMVEFWVGEDDVMHRIRLSPASDGLKLDDGTTDESEIVAELWIPGSEGADADS